MRLLLRSAIGFALLAGGLTLFAYGLAQSVGMGNCGTDEYGRSIGPPCPSGFGPMVVLMVGGVFAAVTGAAFVAVNGRAIAGAVAAGIIAAIAAAVLGIVDLHDDDTRPGMEVVAAVLAPVVLLVLPALATAPRRKSRPAVAGPPPTPAWTPPDEDGVVLASLGAAPPRQATAADAEEVASRLRQLDQLKQSGLLGDDEYKARRTQILGEL